jgi:hypothetical protein
MVKRICWLAFMGALLFGLGLAQAGDDPAAKKAADQDVAEGKPVTDAIELMARRGLNEENPLHSEVTLNGKLVDIFSGDTHKSITRHLRQGWNTIQVKTTPQESASRDNSLIFQVGPMEKSGKREALTMRPVLWKFHNEGGWKFRDGKYSYLPNPEAKDSSRTYHVYYAGLGHELRSLHNGDYVVVAKTHIPGRDTPVTVTLFINGTPLNTFLGEDRQLVVTPWLREGKNEIRIVSARVKNSVDDNDLHIEVGGPAEYSARQQRYLYHRILQISGREGWSRHDKTGQFVSKKDPEADRVERTVSFVLDQAPKAAEQ